MKSRLTKWIETLAHEIVMADAKTDAEYMDAWRKWYGEATS